MSEPLTHSLVDRMGKRGDVNGLVEAARDLLDEVQEVQKQERWSRARLIQAEDALRKIADLPNSTTSGDMNFARMTANAALAEGTTENSSHSGETT